MPSIKTESKAVNALVSSIEDTRLMVPYIDKNDKTPIWDGFIYLYSDPSLTKNYFAGRAPVQVKGHGENDLSKARVSHDAKVADLKAYHQDGGAIYFLIYVAEDRRASKIYYADLTKEKLEEILAACAPDQEKKTIRLSEFPKDNEEKTRIIREFIDQYRPVYRPPAPQPREDIALKVFPMLKELTCQRISADPENFDRIQKVELLWNSGIAAYLKHLAWEEDTQGQCAHYLIKNQENEILMLFSLKAGILYQSLDEEAMVRQYEDAKTLLEAAAPGVETKKDAYRELMRARGNLLILQQDRQMAPNSGIRAETTSPAVELFHFFLNDGARDSRKRMTEQLNAGLPLSQVLFWAFVVPVIRETQKQVGCRYVYTFVPDGSSDQQMVRYYQERLNFTSQEELSVVKPQYDFCCSCLYQSVDEMETFREKFFREMGTD